MPYLTASIQVLRTLILLGMVLIGGLHGQATPPRAAPGTVLDTILGQVVPDPFRYLETDSGPVVQTWVRAQDRYAREFAAGSRRHRQIGQALTSIAEATVYTPPLRRGSVEFYSTFQASGPGAAIEVYLAPIGVPGSRRVLPGLEAHRRRTGENALLFLPSPDGRLVAVGFSQRGTAWLTIRVLRVADGALLLDSVPAYYRPLASLSWLPSSDGFFYDHFEPDTGSGPRSVSQGVVRLHRLGLGGPDATVFGPRVETNAVVGHALSPDGHYLVLQVTDGDTRATRLWFTPIARPEAEPTPIEPPAPGPYVFAGEWAGRLYFLTWGSAARGKVIAFEPEGSRWRDIVPEGPDPINTWPGVGVTVVGGRVLVAYTRDSHLELRLFRPDGTGARAIALPRLGSIWSGFVGRPGSSEVFYQLQTMADPGTVYALDLRSGKSRPYLKPALNYDPDEFLTERRLYPSVDGTLVPIHIVRRAAQRLDGSAPLIMYAYGFQGWIASPWFQPAMAEWVRNGGIWALAGVRGGGEFGEEWQAAGARRNKQKGIDDYLAATDWLIANRYTSADRMVANASSAGGPLVAAAVLQRPALFRAAIFDYAIFDMLRYNRYSHARSWQSAYGTASNPEDFPILRRYSPYHAVRAGQCYPAILVAPGELDQTAPPFHSFKFIAALQDAGSSCGRPALLRVTWGAGHSAGATAAAAIETWTDELGFLDRVLPSALPEGSR